MYESFGEGFGDMTIGDVKHTRLIVPCVNLTEGVPHLFRSAHLPEAIPDLEVSVCDLLVAATAAPTYFPHKEIKESAYVDGALWSADPSMLAVAEAMRIAAHAPLDCPNSRLTRENIHILSIGTGISQYSLAPPSGQAGVMYWMQHIAEVMGSAQTQGIHEPLKFILGNNYTHLNFPMEEKWALDGVENIPALFELGKERAREEYDMLVGCFFGHQRTQFTPVDPTDRKNTEVPPQYSAGNT